VDIELKKILCPVDFSKHSDHALRYAVAFARLHKAELHLLHVMEMPVYTVSGDTIDPGYSVEAVRELETAARKRLENLASRVQSEHDAVSFDLVTGTPFVEIVQTARKTDADIIVMGTHGRTGLAHVLIGSVAEKVVRKAPCPVLTVKHPEQEFVMP
jgi:nucleotide-binding universal stress UspA family protein